MKKSILLFTCIFILSLTGCSAADDHSVHRDANLIVTNYSGYEISDIEIARLGKTISVSPKPFKDTQICYFTIDPADDYIYTVSFVDNHGEKHSQEFTSHFTKDTQILIAIQYSDGNWTIGYDK